MARFGGRIANISLQIVHTVDNLQGKKGVMGFGFGVLGIDQPGV